MNKHPKNYRTESFNGRKPPGIRWLANESGAALIVALVLLAVMMTLVPVAMQMTIGEMDRTTDFKEDRQLFYLAEAGLEHGVAILKDSDLDTLLAGPDGLVHIAAAHFNNDDNGTVAVVGTPVTWNGNLYNEVNFNSGTYKFRIYDNDDGDGDLNKDADGLGFIESVGISADGTTKVMRAMVHKVKIARPPGAVTVVGPTAEIEIESQTFSIEGTFPGTMNGYAIDGTEDTTCDGVNGMAIEAPGPLEIEFDPTDVDEPAEIPCPGGSASCIKLELDSDGSTITGIGGGSFGNPDVVVGQTSLTALDAAKMHRQLTVIETPDYYFTGSVDIDVSTTYGSPTAPVVVYFDDELEITEDMTGYGVLIINDEFEIEAPASLTWYGIVLFSACPTCDEFEFEPDNSTIYGALIVGGEEFEIEDSGIIRYSCAAIDMANGVFDNVFSIISWEEIS